MIRQFVAGTRRPPFVDPQSLMEDPHGRLAALRVKHPVIQLSEGDFMALRAADVLAVRSAPGTIQIEGPDYVRLKQIPDGFAARFLRDFFLFSNGDAHRSVRGLFARAFAYRTMREAQPRIRAVADEIVAKLPRDSTFDFVDRMAARVPADMIASILGFPKCEVPYFTKHVYTLARAVTPVYPHPDHEEIEAAAFHLHAYVLEHMLHRLDAPQDDFLSMLVADWREKQTISFGCLVNQVLGIVIGGSDTTRAAFAMMVALLARRPEDWAAVKADPNLIPGAVAEALRYEPSVGSIAHFTVAPVEIGNVTLPAGSVVRLSTMSAMRDPQAYAEPDRFDIHRADHPRLHPVFGMGAHRCIGEMLARIEMQEGLASLVDAVSGIEVLEMPRMIGFGGIRQITRMPVRIR